MAIGPYTRMLAGISASRDGAKDTQLSIRSIFRRMAPGALGVLGVMGAVSAPPAAAAAVTYHCAATQRTISHDMAITTEGGQLTGFDYSSSTPVAGSVNNCTVDSHGATLTTRGDTQSFVLEDGSVVRVVHRGERYVFDFSKVDLAYACGSSSAIASTLTLDTHRRRCAGITYGG